MAIGTQTDTLPTQGSLICRLRDLSDNRSWNQFFERYQQRVIRIAQGQGLNAHDAEEVAHEVFKRVARTISAFELTGRPGSFRRWLFNLTYWRATDQLRERSRFFSIHQEDSLYRNDPSRESSPLERVPAPCLIEAALREEASRYALDALIKQVEHLVSPRQLQIFQLLVIDEADPSKVARDYGMNLSSIYATKSRVAAKLRKEICRMPSSWE